MAEWRLARGWSSEAMRTRLDQLETPSNNPVVNEEEMTGARGWHHYHSEAVIAMMAQGEPRFERACVALANYQFSDPAIVRAHFDPDSPLLGRRVLLEIRALGIRYLCPAMISRVRDDADAFGFRYDTLEGHIERGVEWFLITRNERGEIRFRIEARWQRGQFPNWWSRVGFMALAGHYQRKWHRRAHQRLSWLAHYGATRRPGRDAKGLTHQGVDVTFTYHTKRKLFS